MVGQDCILDVPIFSTIKKKLFFDNIFLLFMKKKIKTNVGHRQNASSYPTKV